MTIHTPVPMPPSDLRLPRHCSFEADDWHILARHWYPVARCEDVHEKGLVAARLLDEPLVVYRSGHEIVVAKDICPHRGVPLTKGSNEDGSGVACSYHGLRFGGAGKCVHVPAHPDNKIPAKFNLATYPVALRYGLVWTCLRPSASSDGPTIPEMAGWDEQGFQRIVCPWIDVLGFAGRQIEGFLDVAHFGFVHADTFGDPDNVVVPPYDVCTTLSGFDAIYDSTVANYPIGNVGRDRPGFLWRRHFKVHLPFVATLEVRYPEDGRLVIMNAASPASARVTRLFCPMARNFDTDLPVQDVYDFNRRVFEEDKHIVESQMPEHLPLDPTLEAHIPADRSSIAYRRGLKGMGLGQFFVA
ncbi:aromatic ring-hydroxylating dioxygenase subunit alpha [Methylobacterium oryzae]|uniref:(2Fe-2S)-binding protein n=1 Tax=Methylobacterium oryzae TaxID=334852 RepID=A0ABU7TUP6_9HYPH